MRALPNLVSIEDRASRNLAKTHWPSFNSSLTTNKHPLKKGPTHVSLRPVGVRAKKIMSGIEWRVLGSYHCLYAKIALFTETVYPSYFLLKDITSNKEKVRLDSDTVKPLTLNWIPTPWEERLRHHSMPCLGAESHQCPSTTALSLGYMCQQSTEMPAIGNIRLIHCPGDLRNDRTGRNPPVCQNPGQH